MNHVLAAAAVADILLLLATAVLGAFVDGTHLYLSHFALGLFTSILTLLIHVVVFTYFSATGRMISQAVWIGHLDRAPLERVRNYKARVIRCVAVSVGTIVAAVSFGALCSGDPGWRMWHMLAAMVALGVNAAAFHTEYGYVRQNREMMSAVFAAYNAARDAEHGAQPT